MQNDYLLLNNNQISLKETVFLPIGSIEGHGDFLPLGTDTIIAKGFASAFACQTGGVLLPPVWYGITPNTNNLGAISVRHNVLVGALKDLCCELSKAGFTKIILVNIHNGNDASIKMIVENLFMQENMIVYYLNPYTFIREQTSTMFKDNSEKESALFLAACKELGIKLKTKLPEKDTHSPRNDVICRLRKYGYIGFEYETEKQHIDERVDIPLDKAVDYFNIAKAKVVELLEDLDSYTSSKSE